MAEKLKLELVTPYKKVLTEEVDEITATGSLGEFGVLPGHAPFLSSLKIGEFSYKADSKVFHLAVNWGRRDRPGTGQGCPRPCRRRTQEAGPGGS